MWRLVGGGERGGSSLSWWKELRGQPRTQPGLKVPTLRSQKRAFWSVQSGRRDGAEILACGSCGDPGVGTRQMGIWQQGVFLAQGTPLPPSAGPLLLPKFGARSGMRSAPGWGPGGGAGTRAPHLPQPSLLLSAGGSDSPEARVQRGQHPPPTAPSTRKMLGPRSLQRPLCVPGECREGGAAGPVPSLGGKRRQAGGVRAGERSVLPTTPIPLAVGGGLLYGSQGSGSPAPLHRAPRLTPHAHPATLGRSVKLARPPTRPLQEDGGGGGRREEGGAGRKGSSPRLAPREPRAPRPLCGPLFPTWPRPRGLARAAPIPTLEDQAGWSSEPQGREFRERLQGELPCCTSKLLPTLRAECKDLPVPLWQRTLKDAPRDFRKPPHSFPGQQQVTEVPLVLSHISPGVR